MTVKVGIIGTGSISRAHLDAYAAREDVEIYALCDLDSARVSAIAEEYNVEKVYTDYKEMLKLKELDAVSVCTWNSAHAVCSIDALKAGKHVLCEKPMAASVQEALLMEQAAEESGKLLMIGFVRRHGRDCKALKSFIESGTLGDIYYAKAVSLRRIGNPGGWFGRKEFSGGGPLIDLGVHVIDLSRYLAGNPKPVSVYGAVYGNIGNRNNIKGKARYLSASARHDDVSNVEDMASAMVRFDNGLVLSVETSFSINIKKDVSSLELFGAKGGAKLSTGLEIFTEMNDYLTDISLDADTSFNFEQAFGDEISNFIDCIQGKAQCMAPAGDGVEISKIIEAVYKSAEKGSEIKV